MKESRREWSAKSGNKKQIVWSGVKDCLPLLTPKKGNVHRYEISGQKYLVMTLDDFISEIQ